MLRLLVLVCASEAIGYSLWNSVIQMYELQGLPYREEPLLNNKPILNEYDFVVVGSGPAGSAVARRLSEIADWKVLILEGGREGTIYNDIPLISPFFILTNYSWGYKAEPQPDVCLGLEESRCLWPSGKGVGGATIINGMLMTRGHPHDYDRWSNEGNPGWSYNEILRYFLKSEHMTIPELRRSPYHSTFGPVNVEHPATSKLAKRFILAGKEFGYETVDYNDGRTPIGFSLSQASMKKGKRHSAADAYLFPVKDHSNIHVAKNARVTKILIDANRQATGVVFVKGGKKRTVYVRKEVIVSAGSFNTPQLLMLSGIGPKDHLDRFNIPVLQDLPVGDNLQEHLTTVGATFLINTTDSYTLRKLLTNPVQHFRQWLNYGKGPMATNGAEGIAYIKTNKSNTLPDVEFIFFPATLASDNGLFLRKTMGITDKTFFPAYSKIAYAEGFSIWPMGMYPESRGQVRLRSSNPNDPPLLIPNFLTNPKDVRDIVNGLKEAIKLGETNTFKQIGATLHRDPIPGCENLNFGSDAYWECVLRTVPVHLHHQCCTCKMGPNRFDSVVDPRLKVHGVHGLRVADASIMPSITGAHTMSTCYMIGEKAADLIKEDWNRLL